VPKKTDTSKGKKTGKTMQKKDSEGDEEPVMNCGKQITKKQKRKKRKLATSQRKLASMGLKWNRCRKKVKTGASRQVNPNESDLKTPRMDWNREFTC